MAATLAKKRQCAGLALTLLVTPLGVSAATGSPPQSLAWGAMVMGLGGGLALFMLGLEQVTEALKAAVGTGVQARLGHLTANRFSGVLIGALATAMLQSSSVTTVLVVGFVSAGLMTLSQSVGVIMGANIGSTLTAQIIAFKVTGYALALVAAGFAMLTFARRERFKQYGRLLLGLGMLFFGMGIMTDAMLPLRDHPPFLEWMVHLNTPLMSLAVGALLTALIQSSAATMGLVIILASQGFVSLPTGIALALGANIGTCGTALLAAIGKPRVALRAAAVHIIFNLFGVLLWIGFIDQLAGLTILLSPQYAHLDGVTRLAAESPRQIANANTLFNVVNTCIFIGFAPLFVKLVLVLFPDRREEKKPPAVMPEYLDRNLLDTPAAALNLVRMEIGHLGGEVLQMAKLIRPALEAYDSGLLHAIQKRDDAVDLLHGEILTYLSALGKRQLTDDQAQEYFNLSQAADTLERIGDVIESELVETGFRLTRLHLRPGPETRELLGVLHTHVYNALVAALGAVTENDPRLADEALALRWEVNEAAENAFRRQVASMAVSDPERLTLLQLEFEVTDKFKQMYSLAKRIARLYVAHRETVT